MLAVGVQALEALADREPEDVTLLHVVDPSALRAGRNGNPVASTRALAAMDKAGEILLREAERSTRVALGLAATGPRTTLHHDLSPWPHRPDHRARARRGRLEAEIQRLTLMGHTLNETRRIDRDNVFRL